VSAVTFLAREAVDSPPPNISSGSGPRHTV
jgi:hypothetical protein